MNISIFNFDANLPTYDSQQATGGSFPYDTNTGDADQGVDALISGSYWQQTALTFGFASSAADYEANYYDSTAIASVSGFNATQMGVTYDALGQYAAISGLTFEELGDNAGERVIDADLRLARSDAPGTAYAYYPSTNPVGGDAFFNTSGYNSPQIGNYQYHTFLHELGHALGLKHGQDTSGPGAIPYEFDSMEYSVMTYRSWVGKPLTYGYANETWGYSQSLMMLDVAAIQRMYGANFATNAGDTVYSFSTTTGEMFVDGIGTGTPGGNRVFRTVWDGNGNDTYDFSNYTTSLNVDLTPGGYVDLDANGNFQRAMLDFGYAGNPVTYARGHLFNALQYQGDARSLIENAKGGSGDDVFTGNAADNTFTGNGGNDIFLESAGNDTYLGGTGLDQLVLTANYSAYSFGLFGEFLEVTAADTDRVESSVETLVFADVTVSWTDIAATFAPNIAPTASDDAYRVTEDVVLTGGNVLANDSDPDAAPLALSVAAVNGSAANVGSTIALASGALLTVASDGSFVYDQNGAFDALNVGQTGTDSFTYTASDGSDTASATVTITIDGAFDSLPPVAVNDTVTVDEDVVLSGLAVLANDSDPEGDPLSITMLDGQAVIAGDTVMLASGARVTLNADGTVAYDQNGAFNALDVGQTGADSFTYTITDGNKSDQATVSITINGAFDNQAPVAVNDAFSGDEAGPIAGNVLANDSDADGGVLAVAAVNGSAAAVGSTIALASGALLTVNADGTFSYDTNGAFDALVTGQSASDGFTYTVVDGQGGSDSATVALTIAGVSPQTVAEPVLIDFEGVPAGGYAGEHNLIFAGLTVVAGTALSGAAYGATGADGQFVITAGGADFDFDAASFISAGGRVRVDIAAYDDGVLVGTDSFNAFGNRSADRAFSTAFDSIDRVEISARGEIYADNLAFTTHTEILPGGNTPPVAHSDAFTTTETATVSGNLLADNGFGADSDPDGDPLALVSVEGDTDGSVTLASGALVLFDPSGSFSYDPNGAFDSLYDGQTATDSFTYQISDGHGGSDMATVTVDIAGAGTPPPAPIATVIDFEGGSADQDGFVFTNLVLTNRQTGVVSGSFAGESVGDSFSFARSDSAHFDFDSGFFTAVSGKRVDLLIEGYDNGTLVGSETVRIQDHKETGLHLSDAMFDNVDHVVITASGGVIVDDLGLFH
ncbi:MAG: cadherin-like domain-containing protein [Alphaproteobacteria bacterium]|nr:cadherin-like domain-containing protein [Alphaproteobacteria bacterium]MCB9928960.1 cadherin-like domain-containing protein [Alphaproteobacteria bacterium]